MFKLNDLPFLLPSSHRRGSHSLRHYSSRRCWFLRSHSPSKWRHHITSVCDGACSQFHIGVRHFRCYRSREGHDWIWSTAGHRNLCVHLSYARGEPNCNFVFLVASNTIQNKLSVLANHNRRKQNNEPIRIRTKCTCM